LSWADFPNLDSASQDRTTAASTTLWGVFAVNEALNATNVINEWVLNPGLEELSSWVLTFPTKALTVAAVNNINTLWAAVTPATTTRMANNFNGCQPVALYLYNREEKTVETDFSGIGGTNELCNETNVIDFVDTGRNVSAANILSSKVSKVVDTAVLASPFAGGWLNLAMPTTSVVAANSLVITSGVVGNPGEGLGHAYSVATGLAPGNINFAPTATPPTPTLTTLPGRPVIGFNITQRSIPTEDASLYDHAYVRPVYSVTPP
jgi:hypothetical protein